MSFIRWLIAVVVIAALAHGVALYFGPSLIMGVAMGRMAEAGGINHIYNAPLPNAANDRVVRSSPDLLYSTCVYDVSERPLLLKADIPPDTYWSAAFYDLNTNNYRVINDRQTASSIAVMLVKAGTPSAAARAGVETIVSPTDRGLILIRTLVKDRDALAALDETRKSFQCEPGKQE